jgi:hypothetical protein
MKDSASSKRILIITTPALIQPSARYQVVFFAATVWTNETIGPPGVKQILITGFFSREAFLKL